MLMRSLAKVIIASINTSFSVCMSLHIARAPAVVAAEVGSSERGGSARSGQRKHHVDGLSEGVGPPMCSRQGPEETVLSVCGRSLSRQTPKVLPPKKIN